MSWEEREDFASNRPTFERLDALLAESAAKAQQLSAAIKSQVSSGDNGLPNEAVRRLVQEGRKRRADFLREMRLLRKAIGVSEKELRAIEQAKDAHLLPPVDNRFWREQVEEIPPSDSEDLDELAQTGVERLLARVNKKWLLTESQNSYRLDSGFLCNPLHLVSGVRVGPDHGATAPQRFAKMLLVTLDHLMKTDDLDFFSASMFVPEIAQLGNSLEQIKELGPEADRKLDALPFMDDALVSATIYELLVGAACVRKGLKLTMLPENRAKKVPDYQISDLGPFSGAIECKRRLGLTLYELDEADRVQRLYTAVRPLLAERELHGSLEVCFNVPVKSVQSEQFIDAIMALTENGHNEESTATDWGLLRFQRLPFLRSTGRTRLYSPEYLEQVFGWSSLQDEWDGLICEVEPPNEVAVEIFKRPLCFKWRCEYEEALTKKARGITSLWANAIKQVPAGDIGFIYLAYPEGARPALADARTRHILRTIGEVWHGWTIRVPVTVINRLYPRALGPGSPDLIESALPGVADGEEFWLKKLPTRIFTDPIR